MYGKIVNDAVVLWAEGSKEGFYPIVMTEFPQDDAPEGYYYEPHWEQGEDSIIKGYHLESHGILPEEALSILLGGDTE